MGQMFDPVSCPCMLLVLQAQNPRCVVVVDNCYGEFVETLEPTAVVFLLLYL